MATDQLSTEISSTLVLRVDANTGIGAGHLMRCLALAQGWQDAWRRSIFIMAKETPRVFTQRLRDEGFEIYQISTQAGSVEDALSTVALARRVGSTWIAVDGYHFGAIYQRVVKDSGLRLMFVDDNGHADHYYADILINQNLHAHEDLYLSREPYVKLLLGTRFILLRRQFFRWRGLTKEIPKRASKVLVTLGGSDPKNVTLAVVQALKQMDEDRMEAIVVVGGNNPHYGELRSAAKLSQFPIQLEWNVSNIANLMAWADVAVTAGGTTCWELAFMAVPYLVLVWADNQHAVAERLEEVGVAVNLGWNENLSSSGIATTLTGLLDSRQDRAEMARRGQQLVDGEGIARVLMHLDDKNLRLRPVDTDDCKLLWEWANDSEVRKSAFSSDPIPWENHEKWFRNKLDDRKSMLFIAVDIQDRPVGQVRFDLSDDGQAEIDVSIDVKSRRLGYGSHLIDISVAEIFRTTEIRTIHAFIKPRNRGSMRAFEKANFQKIGEKTVKGNLAIHYLRARNNEK